MPGSRTSFKCYKVRRAASAHERDPMRKYICNKESQTSFPSKAPSRDQEIQTIHRKAAEDTANSKETFSQTDCEIKIGDGLQIEESATKMSLVEKVVDQLFDQDDVAVYKKLMKGMEQVYCRSVNSRSCDEVKPTSVSFNVETDPWTVTVNDANGVFDLNVSKSLFEKASFKIVMAPNQQVQLFLGNIQCYPECSSSNFGTPSINRVASGNSKERKETPRKIELLSSPKLRKSFENEAVIDFTAESTQNMGIDELLTMVMGEVDERRSASRVVQPYPSRPRTAGDPLSRGVSSFTEPTSSHSLLQALKEIKSELAPLRGKIDYITGQMSEKRSRHRNKDWHLVSHSSCESVNSISSANTVFPGPNPKESDFDKNTLPRSVTCLTTIEEQWSDFVQDMILTHQSKFNSAVQGIFNAVPDKGNSNKYTSCTDEAVRPDVGDTSLSTSASTQT